MRTFADIPGEVRRRVDAGERVALILLDALGLEQLERERDHPLFDRLAIEPVRSQFPPTTCAHVTTLHLGVPVTEHGLYEWAVYEPALDEIILPLRFTPAGAAEPERLSGRLDPAALIPGPTFYQALGAPSVVLQPAAITATTYTRVATAGATTIGFEALEDGLEAMARALNRTDARLASLYWPQIDTAGHRHGPASSHYRAAARSALDAVATAVAGGGLQDVTVLLCADHGQVDVSPERVDYLDDLWPQLPALLSQPRPAGSPRDAFLHVVPGVAGEVIDGLADRLGDRARVCHATELFHPIGPRLAARLGDVAVLPAHGRQAWLRSAAGSETHHLGQHGGLESAETSTYLARLEQ